MTSIVQAPVRVRNEEPAPPTKKVSVFVWEKDKENDYVSKGKIVKLELPVSDDFDPENPVLTTKHIKVIGMQPFTADRKPGDEHQTRTENHDSFDQAVAFKFYQLVQKTYERLTANDFGTMVAAKTNLVQFKATANGMRQLNAYYAPFSEEMVYGTHNGKWDLASDGDVVIHEMGHFILDHLYPSFSSDHLHESFGDQLSAFTMLDPEISEDFGVTQNKPAGEGLRDALNDLTISSAGNGGHAQSRVYTGLMWDIAELMHEQITDTPRNQEVDKEPLNRDAGDACASILLDWPLKIGANNPSNAKWVATLEKSIRGLKRANKLHPKIDVEAVIQKLKSRAIEREILRSTEELSQVDQGIESNRVASLMDELKATFSHVEGLHIQYGPVLDSVDGSKIRRGRLNVKINHEGLDHNIPVEDDLVTLTRNPSSLSGQPKYRMELGALGKMAILPNDEPSLIGIGQKVPLDMMQTWAEMAQAEAGKLLDNDADNRQAWMDKVVDLPNPDTISMMQEKAKDALTQDKIQARLFYQGGVLKVKLHLDTLSFVAPVTRNGLGQGTLKKAIMID